MGHGWLWGLWGIDSLGKRKLPGLSGSTIPAHPSNNLLEMEWTNMKRLNWTFQEPLRCLGVGLYRFRFHSHVTSHTGKNINFRRTRNAPLMAKSLHFGPQPWDLLAMKLRPWWQWIWLLNIASIFEGTVIDRQHPMSTLPNLFRLLSYGIGTPQIWHGHISFWGLPAGSLDSGARILGSMLNLAKPSDNNSFFGHRNGSKCWWGLPWLTAWPSWTNETLTNSCELGQKPSWPWVGQRLDASLHRFQLPASFKVLFPASLLHVCSRNDFKALEQWTPQLQWGCPPEPVPVIGEKLHLIIPAAKNPEVWNLNDTPSCPSAPDPLVATSLPNFSGTYLSHPVAADHNPSSSQ